MMCYLMTVCFWLFIFVTDLSLCLCFAFMLATMNLLLHVDIFKSSDDSLYDVLM